MARSKNNNASSANGNLLLPNTQHVNTPVVPVAVGGGGSNQNNVEVIAPSGSVNPQPPKRRRYNRHTPQQRNHMEEFFKECPHPDDKQRKELSALLGLTPLQIKFWFQNKRTQVKSSQDRCDNDGLRLANQDLRAENESYRNILDRTKCLECGGPSPFEEQKLIAENFVLRQEIERVKKLLTNLFIQAPQTSNPKMMPTHELHNNTDIAGPSLNNNGAVSGVNNNDVIMPSLSLYDQLLGNFNSNLPSFPDNNVMAPTTAEGVVAGVNFLPPQDTNNMSSMGWVYEDDDMAPLSSLFDDGLDNNNFMLPAGLQLNEGAGVLINDDSNNNLLPNLVGEYVPPQYYNDNTNTNININMMMPSSSSTVNNQGVGVGSSLLRRLLLPIVLANGRVSDTAKVIELALESLEEFKILALAAANNNNNLLWVLGDYNAEILNEKEYFRTFPNGMGPKTAGFRSESSRDSMVVPINHITLIEILMDVGQWSRVFCGIVSKAAILEVLSKGPEGSYDGCIQVMSAQFQIASTYVPPREYDMVRYCKQLEDGSWAVVDVSLDSMRPSPTAAFSCSRRRPSGCLIQPLPDGFSSKVTWVEHVEVDDKLPVAHSIYKCLIESCLAFGARRWMALLNGQCQRIAATLITHIPQGQHSGICFTLTNREVRKSLMKLSERMVKSFYIGVGHATPQGWTTLTPAAAGVHNIVRIMTRNVENDPGSPTGIVISAATSFNLTATPQSFFDSIRNETFRTQWDVLVAGGTVQQVGRIENGRDPANCVSMLRVESSNPIHRNLIILEESGRDSTGWVVVFSPLEISSVNALMAGQHPDSVAMLPSGFAIFPDATEPARGGGGCLVTLAFQIMIDSHVTNKPSICSVSSINNLLMNTVEKVKALVNSAEPSK